MEVRKHIDEIIGSIESTTLDGMNEVRLQNRKDTKHVLALSKLPEVLQKIADNYLILEIDGCRTMQYKTLYYDTPDFELYTMHHNGKLNRYKFRSRTYVETNSSFFEIKFKNNKGRTIKNREGRDSIELDLGEDSMDYIDRMVSKSPIDQNLEPKLWVYYKRITLTDKNLTERVTIDLDLGFEGGGNEAHMNDLVIIELKQDKYSSNSLVSKVLREMKIGELGFSKYCIGIASVYDEVKKNRFKEKFRKLEKLITA